MLLVGVDVEAFATAGGKVGDSLIGQVHTYLGFGIGGDGVEEFLQEAFAHHNREHEVVQLVLLVDVGEEAADDHAEAIARQRPGGMFAATARTEVLARHEDAAAVRGIVQHKVRVQRAIGMVTPVAEEVVAKELLVPRRGFQEAGGDDLVGVYVLQRQGDAGGGYDVEFLFHSLFYII